jgi:iron complex outermembrane receptor protein
VTFAGATPLYARLHGTRDVESETLDSIEGGYRALFGKNAYIDVALFHHRHEGIVSLGAPVSGLATQSGTTYLRFDFPLLNAIDGTTRGFEVAPSVTLRPEVTMRGSYSYLSPDFEPRPGTPRNGFNAPVFGGAPHHQVVLQGVITAGRVDVSPAYRYVSQLDAVNVPSYHELDIPVSFRLTPQLTLTAVGQNLLHDHHAEWARDPGPTVEIQRAAYVRLTWRR